MTLTEVIGRLEKATSAECYLSPNGGHVCAAVDGKKQVIATALTLVRWDDEQSGFLDPRIERDANARLILDAFNVFHTTGQSPSNLATENKELRTKLAALLAREHATEHVASTPKAKP